VLRVFMTEATQARDEPVSFPVGYHNLHPDVSLNFQMNRWFGWVGEPEMLVEMRLAAQRIASYADWKREFLALATPAFHRGHLLRAAFYSRSAEFFMRRDDPDRAGARDRFLQTIRSVHGLGAADRHSVPYALQGRRGFLPAYRFKPAQPKSTIVFFGGFDSSIEELMKAFLVLRDAGYDVIAFEGPGQGGALVESGLPMTTEWQKPVAAVLDHFEVERVTLIGLSLGGCLALRAAAEPRVERIVAFDVLSDFSEVVLRQTRPMLRKLLRALLKVRASGVINRMITRVARRSPVVEWGIEQGMHVTGTGSPYEFLRRIGQIRTTDVSSSVTQHVLLLAGAEDHYVPLAQWHQQIALLTNARSVTARLFTRAESAQNHCQAGNYGLALATIIDWLDSMMRPETP
jgi:pimeloyl-ACP methyl ester carboxylesterase